MQRNIKFYNLDAIISVGYRVNSIRGTHFRQWATQRLKDYLVKGYAINEERLEQKQQELIQLKTGIQILSRAINVNSENQENEDDRERRNGVDTDLDSPFPVPLVRFRQSLTSPVLRRVGRSDVLP